ncbi:MAG: hypothetical protein JNIBNLAF_01488 [Nitrosomonas europaea]|nr:hypothetical protein [Nitrosomonas europaea]
MDEESENYIQLVKAREDSSETLQATTMSAQKNTSVTLGEHFEKFLAHQVETGRYSSVSEVVRAGLRLLEEREQLELDALRAEIAAGRASSPTKSAEAVFDRLEAKYAAQVER